ncbi:HEAT repeat domain-containing protein [Capnocytophaga felis]|uniref:HEAT repeat domain-containing protein n=1 Tax=Capnocytophaga felis TaxID=2267611 RepID=A0A5M4BBI7_9FLAO|nr:HEAT repeat domain-containing protein [Capnocytophaga felis]GET46682.1 hypothetical protein RCZ01_19840 [Capnocytophaga felis]GET48784.1 hypothetical protein RCZ02_16150 [Capnocytophaga felis]
MKNIFIEKLNQLDDDQKYDFIREVEFEETDEKWDLFNIIIANEAEYDLARIEALKIIAIYDIPNDKKPKIAQSLEYIITNEEDYLVRNYAIMALRNFIEYPTLIKLAKTIVSDSNEDENCRHNALSAIEKMPNEAKKEILTSLLTDKYMKPYVQQILDEM